MSNITIKRLLTQLQALAKESLEDVAILPSDDPTQVNAIIFGPAGTPYENGAFRMKLVYGSDYPTAPPTGTFITKIFHPNVDSLGSICVNTLKRDWTSDVTVSHILLIIKCLLINPGPDSALNEDAGKLLMESYDDFARKARIYTSVHAIKVQAAMLELSSEQRKSQRVSYRDVKVLTSTDVNKTTEAVDEGSVSKKRKIDPKRRALKRL